jgi:hypothetical protein
LDLTSKAQGAKEKQEPWEFQQNEKLLCSKGYKTKKLKRGWRSGSSGRAPA